MKRQGSWLASVLVLASVAQGVARAEEVTFVLEGTVDSVFDGLGALDGSVATGASIRGFYTFDSETKNTSTFVGEGEIGLYEHTEPPAGVSIKVGDLILRSVPDDPEFDINVANDFGFAGTDEYGFSSRNNEAIGLLQSAPIQRLDLVWHVSAFGGNVFANVDLPVVPPDIDLFSVGGMTLEGECTVCLGPAAFFRIEATVTRLEAAVWLSLGSAVISWDGTPTADLVYGDLSELHAVGFAAATDACVTDDEESGSVSHVGITEPLPGDAIWFLSRPAPVSESGASDASYSSSYSSWGLGQMPGRDPAILASGHDCPE